MMSFPDEDEGRGERRVATGREKLRDFINANDGC